VLNPLLSLLIGLGIVALCGFVFWPRIGLLSRWKLIRRITRRVRLEDALKNLKGASLEERILSPQDLAGRLQITVHQVGEILEELSELELVSWHGDLISLTHAGHDHALHIMRAHRLWESYLAEKTGFAAGEWHDLADTQEHTLTPEETDALSAQLGFPKFDPHGDPIPNASGDLIQPSSQALASLKSDEIGRIVHVEDEPESIAAQILAEGLELGMLVRQTEVTPQRVSFWSNGDEHVLAPIVAANISVEPISYELLDEPERLSILGKGESANVTQISPSCRGAERRRLMDLGILPGTRIKAEFISPGGDPTAYRIRGAVIALRKEQAKHIRINRLLEESE
jgi:DtxR family Mn-dependent transcriptional regulator